MLKNLSSILKKPFAKATKNDIIKLVSNVEKNKDYKDSTKHEYKVTLKRFYRWLRNVPKPDYSEEVKWIITTMKLRERILPDDLWIEEDIKIL